MVDEAIPLSQREQEILHLVATGATNQQVARDLCISVNTVKVHLRNIYAKVGAESRTEATMWAVQSGLIVVGETPRPVEVPDESGPAPDTDVRLEPFPVVQDPISLWKRVFLVVSAVSLLFLALVPPMLHGSSRRGAVARSAFADESASETNRALAPTSRWSSRARMPSPRARLAVAAIDGLVYAIGGEISGVASDAVEAYDPSRNTWQVGNAKPTAVSNVGAIVVSGLIYVPGGMTTDGTVTDALEVYDPVEDEWLSASSLPTPLCAYASAAADKNIYLFGGWDGTSYLDSVYIFDTDKDTWSRGTPMAVARAFLGAAEIKDRIYVVGGYDGRREYALCDEYYPSLEGGTSSPWRERTPMSLPRGGVGVSTVGDSLFAVGGGWKHYLAYNERYDPRSNTWFGFESPIVGQWRNLGLTAVDVSLYAMGGWSEEFLDNNEEYQALYRVILPMRP